MRRRAVIVIMLFPIAVGCDGDSSDIGSGGMLPTVAEAPQPVPVKGFDFDPDVVLLVTGSTRGRMEVCNCGGPMAGGLSRRSGLAISYRKAFGRVVFIDTGDLFAVQPENIRNGYLLRGYAGVGYDAVMLGELEWAALGGKLESWMGKHRLHYVSTSARPTQADLPLSRDYQTAVGAGRLAIISYLGPETLRFAPAASPEALRTGGPEAVLAHAAELKKSGAVVVLAAHATEEELAPFADAACIDLIVRGHISTPEKRLTSLGKTPVVVVGGTEHVGAVALKLSGSRLAQVDYRLEEVSDRWPLDGRVMSIYQAYTHEALRLALDADKKEGLRYVPNSTCGKCHERQYIGWQTGPHAMAWHTLEKVKRTGDPDCLSCHTSGFGSRHGFSTLAKTPDQVNVNCQDCHRSDLEDHLVSKKHPKLTEDTCRICHTDLNSRNFNFQKYRPFVGCVMAGETKE